MSQHAAHLNSRDPASAKADRASIMQTSCRRGAYKTPGVSPAQHQMRPHIIRSKSTAAATRAALAKQWLGGMIRNEQLIVRNSTATQESEN